MTPSDFERSARSIERRSRLTENGCREFLGSVDPSGYGAVKIIDRKFGAHVVVFVATNGPVPEGKEVCHTCDNRRCVRLSHLFAGTRSENVRDCVAKGRHKGFATPNPTKLTADDVRNIRRLRREGMTTRAIAALYPVSRRNIRLILDGTIWQQVSE